jgi:hypothetical protein
VERVNGTLMGVQVEAGASQVEFSSRPTGFLWALGMTGGVLAFSAFKLRSESKSESLIPFADCAKRPRNAETQNREPPRTPRAWVMKTFVEVLGSAIWT